MALDNPSYFTIPGGSNTSSKSRFSLLRRRTKMGVAPSSTQTLPTPEKSKNLGERYSILPSTTNSSSSSNVNSETCLMGSLQSRQSFRSLTSSTSLDDPIQTQLITLGMPRPERDAAPKYSPSIKSKKTHSRTTSTGRSFRSDIFTSSENCRVPSTPPPPLPTSHQDDVFLPARDERYYNLSSTLPRSSVNVRRHSIGTYYNKHNSCRSVTNELKIEEEATLTMGKEEDNKTCNHMEESKGCRQERPKTRGGGKLEEMDDILVISSKHSQVAGLWVTYLTTCFEEIRKNRKKPPFRILNINIEDVTSSSPISTCLEEKMKKIKLQIAILCPVFLDHILKSQDCGDKLAKLMQPDRVLAMLLGIENCVTEEHRNILPSYSQWKKMESVNDRDEKFVGDFLGTALEIITKNSQTSTTNEKPKFVLLPKKINKFTNKIVAVLNEPIEKDDEIKVTVTRNGERSEVTGVKKRNPYNLLFRLPDRYFDVSLILNIRIERNGLSLGAKEIKCESQLEGLDKILRSCDSPVEYMCQALNIEPCDRSKLDSFLCNSFQKNVPPNYNLLQTTGLGHLHRGVISKEQYPTLLHFAAHHGLEKFCWILLECPGAEFACDVRNVNELTPTEMADREGHTKLSNLLSGYMQMTEFTSVYSYLKGITDKAHDRDTSSQDYTNPRPLCETYQIPPSPKPVDHPLGYIHMHSNRSYRAETPTKTEGPFREPSISPSQSWSEKVNKADSHLHLAYNTLKKSRDKKEIQDELVEIINDFKNNVFTISEVEKLVEDWKNRNDVKQSYIEKQEQLKRMREEYERVQLKMKEQMKHIGRPSPMERIRKFFRVKSKDEKKDSLACNRPTSSLSSISSSSGRLSTGSHCSGASLGDSGTHSDPESEKKFGTFDRITFSATTEELKSTFLENYDIPPSPRSLMQNKIENYEVPPSPRLCEFLQNRSDLKLDLPPPPCKFVSNFSTLHGSLTKLSKENESRCVSIAGDEYANIPSFHNGTVLAKRVEIVSSDEEVTRLPNYVNISTPELA